MTEQEKELRIKELRDLLTENPGAEEFVELAGALLETPEERLEAREVCLRGISAEPENVFGRLMLARLYYMDEMPEFAAREIFELRRRVKGETPSLDKLVEAFGNFTGAAPVVQSINSEMPKEPKKKMGEVLEFEDLKESTVVAEIDLDTEFLDALDELNED